MRLSAGTIGTTGAIGVPNIKFNGINYPEWEYVWRPFLVANSLFEEVSDTSFYLYCKTKEINLAEKKAEFEIETKKTLYAGIGSLIKPEFVEPADEKNVDRAIKLFNLKKMEYLENRAIQEKTRTFIEAIIQGFDDTVRPTIRQTQVATLGELWDFAYETWVINAASSISDLETKMLNVKYNHGTGISKYIADTQRFIELFVQAGGETVSDIRRRRILKKGLMNFQHFQVMLQMDATVSPQPTLLNFLNNLILVDAQYRSDANANDGNDFAMSSLFTGINIGSSRESSSAPQGRHFNRANGSRGNNRYRGPSRANDNNRSETRGRVCYGRGADNHFIKDCASHASKEMSNATTERAFYGGTVTIYNDKYVKPSACVVKDA